MYTQVQSSECMLCWRQAVAADIDFDKVGQDMDGASPLEIMDHALATFGDEIAIAFSGATSQNLHYYLFLFLRYSRYTARISSPPDCFPLLLLGAEDVALVEYAHLTGRPFRVFSLDTGRLNPETYRCARAYLIMFGMHRVYVQPMLIAHWPDHGDAAMHRLFDKVEKHYGIRIEYTFPDADEVLMPVTVPPCAAMQCDYQTP